MARKEFALESLASKVGIAEQRARQDYADKKAKEATDFLASQVKQMAKKASERRGLFRGKGGGFLKSALNVGLPLIPGFGTALSLALNAADLAASQDQLRGDIKDMSKDVNVPLKFQGTFLENYLKSGLTGAQAQTKQALKGAKNLNMLSGIISLLPGTLSATKSLASAPKVTSIGKSVGESIAGVGGPESIESVFTNTKPSMPGLLKNIKRIEGMDIPVPLLNQFQVSDFTQPLSGADSSNLIKELTTVSNFQSLLENLYKGLTSRTPEPVISEAQSIKYY